MRFLFIFHIVILLSASVSEAQNDYASRFFLGKQYLEEKSYSLAMEILKPIANDDQENEFREQAAYLYAAAAMKDSLFFQARQMLLQIVNRYSYWEGIDEARYMLGICYFHAQQPAMAFEYAAMISDAFLQSEMDKVKIFYLRNLSDTADLKALYSQFPEDNVLAYRYIQVLNENAQTDQDIALMESLIDVFGFSPEVFDRSTPDQTVIKDRYNVAVLLPFKYVDVHSKIQYDKNKFAYEFYAGLLQAADSLRKNGLNLNIRPFDTRGDTATLKILLKQRVLQESDLIIGPLYPDLSQMTMEYAKQNHIIAVNPFTQNEEYIEDNPYGYLYQPTNQHITRILTQFAIDSLLTDTLDTTIMNMIVMDKTPVDTANAAIIYNHFRSNGFRIDTILVFDKTEPEQFLDIFGDSSHIEDFSNMFVTSNNKMIAGRVFSAVEAGNSQVNILGQSRWLEYDNIDLDQLERRHVYFVYADHIDFENPFYKAFSASYTYDKLPGFFPATGFELMMHFGNALHRFGKNFQQGLKSQGFQQGYLFTGIDYSNGNFNSHTPLFRVEEGKLQKIDYKPKVYKKELSFRIFEPELTKDSLDLLSPEISPVDSTGRDQD